MSVSIEGRDSPCNRCGIDRNSIPWIIGCGGCKNLAESQAPIDNSVEVDILGLRFRRVKWLAVTWLPPTPDVVFGRRSLLKRVREREHERALKRAS